MIELLIFLLFVSLLFLYQYSYYDFQIMEFITASKPYKFIFNKDA